MSRVSIIPADGNLIEEVRVHLSGTGNDYSETTVVFPGKRPAHALRKRLAEEIGHGFIPPRIFSIDTFIDHVYLDHLHLNDPVLEPVDAVAILYEIHASVATRVGGEYFLSLDSFLPLGIKIFGELEELWIANVAPERIRDALSGIVFGEITTLALFYEKFYALARERNYCTRAMKYRAVAENIASIDFTDKKKMIFSGFFGLTGSEKVIFKNLLSRENTLHIFQNGRGIGRQLEELGLTYDAPPETRPSPALHYYRSADTHGQVFGLSGKIAEMLETGRAEVERTAIVLPAAETLFPVIHQSLALLGEEEFNISLGYPLTRTPVYGFLETLMRLLAAREEERYSVAEYMKFILHPYTKNIRFGTRADITRILFNTVEEYFLRSHGSTFFALDDLESKASLFERASKRLQGTGDPITAQQLRDHLTSIHNATLRVFETIANVGGLASTAINVLRYISSHSTANAHPFFRPFAETLVERLNVLSTSLLSEKGFTQFRHYAAFLRSYISDAEVPFTGTPLHGLQVLGFLETRNLQFDTVFILDANDDVLPGNKGRDVLLPFKLREALGLLTYKERERVTEYYFDVLLKGAKEVHLFFVQEGKKEKSRYVEKLLWETQQRERKEDSEEYVRTLRYKIQLANPAPPAVPKSMHVIESLEKLVFNTTILDTYLRCQLRFYYEAVMGLEAKEEVTGETDAAEIGTFVHAALAAYFRRIIGKRAGKELLNPVDMDRIVDEQFLHEYGSNPVGAQYLMKKQIKDHLRDFLVHYQIPMSEEEVVIVEVESKIRGTIGTYQFAGKLDRVEMRKGRIHVLDYKTGSNDKRTKINFKKLVFDDRDSWNDAIGSLQLPIYALLYAGASGKRKEDVRPAYLYLGKQGIDSSIEHPLFDEFDAPLAKMELLETIISRLLAEITNVHHPFQPTSRLDRECPTCAFKYLCGTQWGS